jgi:hypothetical protein
VLDSQSAAHFARVLAIALGLMKKHVLIPAICFGASVLMLVLGLPLTSVSTLGQISTLTFYALVPPFIVVQLFAPHEAHDLEHSVWPQFEYPVAAFISLCWWLLVAWLMYRRQKRVSI